MSKEIQKIDNGKRSQKNLNDDSVEDLLANVDQFIEGVYRDLKLKAPTSATPKNSKCFKTMRSLDDIPSPNDSPIGATSLSVMSSGSPSTRVNMDAEIERINRMCKNVDKNLRSIGVFMNNSDNSCSSEERLNTNITHSPTSSISLMSDLNIEISPSSLNSATPTIIDLSETQTETWLLADNNNSANGIDDDDVILVSANISPVIDLCCPGCQITRSRRRRFTTVVPDVQIVDTSDVVDRSTIKKRRTNYKKKSLNVSITEANKKSPTSGNGDSGHIPYMCSVCMESCLQRQPTSTKCGHIFCYECIMQGIRITRKCPLCNARLKKTDIFRIYP